jgi:hypothetical protein
MWWSPGSWVAVGRAVVFVLRIQMLIIISVSLINRRGSYHHLRCLFLTSRQVHTSALPCVVGRGLLVSITFYAHPPPGTHRGGVSHATHRNIDARRASRRAGRSPPRAAPPPSRTPVTTRPQAQHARPQTPQESKGSKSLPWFIHTIETRCTTRILASIRSLLRAGLPYRRPAPFIIVGQRPATLGCPLARTGAARRRGRAVVRRVAGRTR